jgi:hypothetical protein
MYEITDYSYFKAQKLGVKIQPSTNKKKKIDVFKNGIKIASIGAIGYMDYPHYIQKFGKMYADKRRQLYRLRHSKDRNVKDTPGYFAYRILW